MKQQLQIEKISVEATNWRNATNVCSARELLPGAVPQQFHYPPARIH